ncbi:MAG TPA: ComEC/Rec2 family competence protein [Actinomycetota bacterium]|nr:ComEC/Rec2 family competence protein [Actinomycetota bacterium]
MLLSGAAGALAATARSEASLVAVLARSVPTCDLRGTVLETRGDVALVRADALECGAGRVVDPGATVALREAPASVGTLVVAHGWLVPLGRSAFESSLAGDGVDAELHARSVGVVGVRPGLPWIARRVRMALRDGTQDLHPDQAALIGGLSIGDTSGMGEATLDRLRASGLAHLVAVSGSNVALIVAAGSWAFGRRSLRARVIGGVLLLVVYVAVVGPDPSVLRAATMGAIASLALLGGMRTAPLHVLPVACIVLIAVRPTLVDSVGLHLSVAATAGIVIWSGAIARRLERVPGAIAMPLAMTLAAQAAVAPVLIGTFGEVSVVAPVTNVLAAPAVVPVTVLGLLSGVVGIVSPVVSEMLADLAAVPARYVLWVGDTFGGLPWASAAMPRSIGIAAGAVVLGAAVASVASPRRSDAARYRRADETVEPAHPRAVDPRDLGDRRGPGRVVRPRGRQAAAVRDRERVAPRRDDRPRDGIARRDRA